MRHISLGTPSSVLVLAASIFGCTADDAELFAVEMRSSDALPPISIPVAAPASAVGHWQPELIEGEIPAVSMAVLPDGRVLYFSGYEAASEHDHGELASYLDAEFFSGHPHEADTRVLALADGVATVTTPTNPMGTRPGDLFCTALTSLADGRVLAVGGTDWATFVEEGDIAFFYGLELSQLFDGNAWLPTTDMHVDRWYPSLVTLADGRTLVASGLYMAGLSIMQKAVEIFDPQTETWTEAGEWSVPMYARLSVVPAGPLAGKVFYAPVGSLWAPSGLDATTPSWNLQQAFETTTGEVTLLGPSVFGARQNGVAINLPLAASEGYRPRILSFGGTLQPTAVATNTAETADLGTNPPTNSVATPMNIGRWIASGVLLPDGTVFAVGGALYDNVTVFGQPTIYVMNPELYDPAADTWTLLPPMQLERGYHNTAVLLPDGRVLVGGTATVPFPSDFMRDEEPTSELYEQLIHTEFEIYEPPYLFRGPRPEIVDAPSDVKYGETFHVDVETTSAIASVVLVKPATVTHGYDSSQRSLELAFAWNGQQQLTITPPPNGTVAAPGYYMLFVNRTTPAGIVPSEATIVRVR